MQGPASWSTRVYYKDIRIHPDYNERTLNNDIAMVKLVEAPGNLLSYPYTGIIQLPTEAVSLVDMIGSIVSVLF